MRWNPDDVIDTYASLPRPGNAYKPIDLPYAPQHWPMAHADHVVRDGREIGYSSGTIYSFAFREFLSLGCLDVEVSNIGNEVSSNGATTVGRSRIFGLPSHVFPTSPRDATATSTSLPFVSAEMLATATAACRWAPPAAGRSRPEIGPSTLTVDGEAAILLFSDHPRSALVRWPNAPARAQHIGDPRAAKV